MKIFYLLLVAFFVFAGCHTPEQKNKKDSAGFQLLDTAFNFLDSGKYRLAFSYFNKAKEQFLLSKDSLEVGSCLINMGMIATEQGDNFGARELALNAIPYLNFKNEEHHPYIRSNFNNLGITSFNLKEYDKAIAFYQETLSFTADSDAVRVVKNNIANVYRKQKKYAEALALYQEILKKENRPLNLARVISNSAFTKWEQNPTYFALPELHQALSIRKKEKNISGQNSSYTQLTQYHIQKQVDSALYYAKLSYQTAHEMNSADDRLLAIQNLIKLSPPKEAKAYFNLYQNLNDSLQTARSTAKNQFALIRYETEKHKADNLILQREKTKRNSWIALLIFLMITGSVITLIWQKRRKERLELEAKNAIRENQLKTSKKVHDVVANGLYRLMSEIENGIPLAQDKLLDHMEMLYEQSRDISYDDTPDSTQSFEIAIATLLNSFASAQTKVIIIGNTPEFWNRVKALDKYELKQILQELMVNMKKHSHANQVALRFEQAEENVLKIHYTDNGIGIPEGKIFGNGLRNTGNRIEQIGGHITFAKGVEGGLKILILFPSA